jgi:hypothetical protein
MNIPISVRYAGFVISEQPGGGYAITYGGSCFGFHATLAAAQRHIDTLNS